MNSLLHSGRTKLDRARYHLQRGALLHALTAPVAIFHRLTTGELPRPDAAALDALRGRMADLLEQDLAHMERGTYPRELLFRFPLGDLFWHLPALLQEPPRAAWRRWRGHHEDLPRDVDASALPRYYRRNFHWQTDGWLSDRSAALYDLQVETLFGGTGDVMRRMALPPLLAGLQAKPRPQVLDVACGTGAFLVQLRSALPEAGLTGLDLSPFYLAHAHERLRDGRPVSFVTENAESMPFRDAHFDAVSCVFLFHELPRPARRKVVAEAYRVLAPGGRFVVCDSAQLSDSPELRPFLEAFPALYHEPYFKSYLRDDLGALLEESGFRVEASEPAFLAKVVTGRKPRAS